MPTRSEVEQQAARLRVVLTDLPIMVTPDGQGFVEFEGARLRVDFYTPPGAGENHPGGDGALSGS